MRSAALSRLALALALALGLSPSPHALAAGVFDQPQCVVQLEADAGMISLVPPGSTSQNDATLFAFRTLPEVIPGDLVRVTPAAAGTAEPSFSLVKRSAGECKIYAVKKDTGQHGRHSHDQHFAHH